MRRKREIFGWAMYDFANSAYATTVLAVVFYAYFLDGVTDAATNSVRLFGLELRDFSAWLGVYSLAMFAVVLTGPGLGALADARRGRKVFLVSFCLAGSVATCLMALVGPGDVLLALSLLLVSAYAFSAGNIFYNAFLPDVSTPRTMGRISGLGWGLGYLGGGLCLVVNLVMISRPGWFGIPDVDHLPVRLSVLVAGVWWFLFAIPMFLWVRETKDKGERSRAKGEPEKQRRFSLADGFRTVGRTLAHLRSYRTLFLFVVAFLLYSNGVEAILAAATGFAKSELRMEQSELILCFLMIQGVALAGAFGFGWLADRIGNKRAVLGSLFVWIAVLGWAWFVTHKWEFWALGAMVGLVMGGTQAASRSLMGTMTPSRHKAEFFGFYAFGGRMAAVAGAFVVALIGQLRGNMRDAIVSLIVFFVLGGALLSVVNVARGVREKEEADAREDIVEGPSDPAET